MILCRWYYLTLTTYLRWWNLVLLFGIGHMGPDWSLAAYLGLTWIRHLSLADPHCLPMLLLLLLLLLLAHAAAAGGQYASQLLCQAGSSNVSLHTALGFSSFHVWENQPNLKIYTSSLCWSMPAMLANMQYAICNPTCCQIRQNLPSWYAMCPKSKNEPTMKMENYQHSEDLINQGFEELYLGKATAFCSALILYRQLCGVGGKEVISI